MSKTSATGGFARGALVVLLLALCISSGACAPRWDAIQALIRNKFPKVRQMPPAELAHELKSDAKPVLLDVRTKEEFAVSHLPGARHVDPNARVEDVRLSDKSAPIVTYCSVGYRSSAFAEKLMDAGYRRVANLEGSIFRWANEGRPLVRGGQPAQKVHPYSKHWGQLLSPERRAE